MGHIIIEGNKIELFHELGIARGKYYYKNNHLYLSADKCLDLAILMRYKEEIEEEIKKMGKESV